MVVEFAALVVCILLHCWQKNWSVAKPCYWTWCLFKYQAAWSFDFSFCRTNSRGDTYVGDNTVLFCHKVLHGKKRQSYCSAWFLRRCTVKAPWCILSEVKVHHLLVGYTTAMMISSRALSYKSGTMNKIENFCISETVEDLEWQYKLHTEDFMKWNLWTMTFY